MKRTLAVFTTAVALLAPPAAAQDACVEPDYLGRDLYAADPTALAAAWLRELERLYAAIPSLSPREEQWLREEMVGSGDRFLRAVSSREYAMWYAKLDVGAFIKLLRRALEGDQTEQTKGWIWFIHHLLGDNSEPYLARLVREEVIQLDAIPDAWTFAMGGVCHSKIPSRPRKKIWLCMCSSAHSRPSWVSRWTQGKCVDEEALDRSRCSHCYLHRSPSDRRSETNG